MKRGVVFLIAVSIFFAVFIIGLPKAGSLPTPGGDKDTWGDILNSYLQTEHNSTGQHTNITATDLTTKGPWVDVRAFGATGDGATDDTSAIQAAIDYADSKGGGTVFFPHGTYIITSTITWKHGVRLEGDQGGALVAGRYPELKWGGAENGTMFIAEEISDNWHITDASRLVFRGSGTANPKTLIEFPDRVDYGTVCWKCQFANTNGDAIRLLKGATNFYMYDFRADSIGGYFLYVNSSYGGVYQLDKFTYDTGGTGNADGLVLMDGFNASNNQVTKFGISNARLEVNSNLSGDNNTLVLLGVNPSISDYIQYQILLDNILVAPGTGVENISFIRSVPASNQFTVVGSNINPGSAMMINNSITPGPIQGKQHPFFIFAPFVSGTPGGNNQLISLISKLYVWGDVGIGTTSPSGKFHINTTGDANAFVVNDSTGYIGIGTAAPQGDIEIVSPTAATIYLNRTGARNWKLASDGSGNFWIQMVSPTINAFKIDSTGKFGLNLGSIITDTQVDVGVWGAGIYDILKLRNTYASASNQGTKIVFSSRKDDTNFANIAGIAGVMTNNSLSSYKGDLVFYTANTASPDEKMRLDSSGNLNLRGNISTKGLEVNSSDVWIDVRAYGAKGDGVTDDTAAIQNAINSLPTAGGTIFFPVGRYRVTSNITTNKPSVRLIGAGGTSFEESGGWGVTLLADTAGMALLAFDGNTSLVHQGPIIENINLKDNTGTKSATLLKIRLMNRWTIRDVTFRDALLGLYVDGAGDVVSGGDASWGLVEKVHFVNSTTCLKTNRASSQTIVGGSFVGCNVGVNIDYYTANVKIIGVKFDGTANQVCVWVKGYSNTIMATGFEGCDPAILFDGNASLSPSPPSGYGNKAIGVDVIGSDGTEIGINITANASLTQLIGTKYSYLAADIVDSSKSTKRDDPQEGMLWKTYQNAVPGQLGFIIQRITGRYLPALIVNNNFGLTLIDDENIAGGLWLTADASTRGAVGAGLHGAIAGTFVATGTTASFAKFYNGIEFYTNTGLTANVTYTPTKRLTIDTSGSIILASNTTAITCNAAKEGAIYYSNSTHKHYGCNSTDWNALY